MATENNASAGVTGKRLNSQHSVNGAVKSICDIMRRSNCAGATQYVPELTWILFLRILDERKTLEAEAAEAVGADFTSSIKKPYRWQDWAAPDSKRREELLTQGKVLEFVNGELLPYLKGLRNKPNSTPRQKVISEILSGVEPVRIDTQKNLCDVCDKVHGLSVDSIGDTHVFTLSQVYEGLLLKMGEKANDGGQFFTPREIIRAVVRVVAPKIAETVYDPGSGTGGFLAESFAFMAGKDNEKIESPDQLELLRHDTFFGREKENLIYPIALANQVLHGIDQPNIGHGNTLTGAVSYDGLYTNASDLFDVVMTNPPFGGKEGKEAQTRFAFKTGATQVLFLQHVIDSLKPTGRCGMVSSYKSFAFLCDEFQQESRRATDFTQSLALYFCHFPDTRSCEAFSHQLQCRQSSHSIGHAHGVSGLHAWHVPQSEQYECSYCSGPSPLVERYSRLSDLAGAALPAELRPTQPFFSNPVLGLDKSFRDRLTNAFQYFYRQSDNWLTYSAAQLFENGLSASFGLRRDPFGYSPGTLAELNVNRIHGRSRCGIPQLSANS